MEFTLRCLRVGAFEFGENLDAGLIVLDSPEAVRLGYSSAKFDGHIRLKNGTIFIRRRIFGSAANCVFQFALLTIFDL
jgi:hypothetical protein